jgi:hypothetical protein
MNRESTFRVSSFIPCERTANRTINTVHPDQLNAETLQKIQLAAHPGAEFKAAMDKWRR